ncbi:MAG TPA: hypothetical protein VNW99_12175 [Cytophagaceae bacterium]|nr:hypothetical protein [Cytophagaceae bacterium]
MLTNERRCSTELLETVLRSDFCPDFNPIKDYLLNVKCPDNGIDYIEKLALTVTTTKKNLWLRCFKKWFVGMVACALEEGNM